MIYRLKTEYNRQSDKYLLGIRVMCLTFIIMFFFCVIFMSHFQINNIYAIKMCNSLKEWLLKVKSIRHVQIYHVQKLSFYLGYYRLSIHLFYDRVLSYLGYTKIISFQIFSWHFIYISSSVFSCSQNTFTGFLLFYYSFYTAQYMFL